MALLLAGLWSWQARKGAAAAPSDPTSAVVRGILTLNVTAAGTLQPTRVLGIGRERAGALLKVNSEDDDQVNEGQVLVELDTAKLRDQILRSQAAISTDGITLSTASIMAPADGTVPTRSVDLGNVVAASLQAVTLFIVAENLAQMRLLVYVDAAQVGAAKVDQDTIFRVSADPGRTYPVRISRVAVGATGTDQVVTYLTYLAVDHRDPRLRPGSITPAATRRNELPLAPNAALRIIPTAAEGR